MLNWVFINLTNLTTINKNIFVLVLPLSDLDINCVSLINQYSMGLSNPRTQAMFGILELYDYIMLFLLLILIIKMIFFINALCTSTQYISAYDVYAHEKELKIFDSYFKKLGGVHEEKFNLHKIVFGRITESSMIPKSSPGNIALNDFIRKDFWKYKLMYLKSWHSSYINNRVHLWKHSPVIEYVWTVFPAVILGLMGVPSFLLLYSLEESAEPVFNISVIGNQWYWTYEYLDFDIHKFFSLLVSHRCEEELNTVKNLLFGSPSILTEIGETDNSDNLPHEARFFYKDYSDPTRIYSNTLLLSFQNEESLVDIPLTYRDTVGRHPLKVLVFSENYKHNKMGITLNDFNSFITYINKYRLYALPQTSAEYPSSYYPSISYKLGSSFSSVLQTLETTISIDSQILPDSDLPLGYPRLLSTDQVLVIPTDTTIRFLVTSNDVIHSRALPSFGIKIDAVPGRINQVITKTPFFGSTWGQCSELRGVNHGFMPIEIRAMALNDFNFYIKLLIRSLIEPALDKVFSNSYIRIVFNNN